MRLLQGSLFLLLAASAIAEPQYDLLLRGGHVIDPKDKVSRICDVAIRDRKIAAVAPVIDPGDGVQNDRCQGAVCDPGARRYPCSCFRQHRRAQFVCRRAERLSR